MAKIFKLIALVGLCIKLSAQDYFSCNLLDRPTCLSAGETVCSMFGKCVDDEAICFNQYTCDHNGFVCKSALNSAVDKLDSCISDHNDLVVRFNQRGDDVEAMQTDIDKMRNELMDASFSIETLKEELQKAIEIIDDMESCIEDTGILSKASDCIVMHDIEMPDTPTSATILSNTTQPQSDNGYRSDFNQLDFLVLTEDTSNQLTVGELDNSIFANRPPNPIDVTTLTNAAQWIIENEGKEACDGQAFEVYGNGLIELDLTGDDRRDLALSHGAFVCADGTASGFCGKLCSIKFYTREGELLVLKNEYLGQFISIDKSSNPIRIEKRNSDNSTIYIQWDGSEFR